MSAEDKFQKIAEEVAEKLDLVDCSMGEYQAGIKLVMDELETQLQAAIDTDGDLGGEN